MGNNIKENITKFILIGIPIIAIVAAVFYSFFSKRTGFSSGKNGDKNPYEYNIEDLKKVDPKLVKYKEGEKLPLSFKNPTALAITRNNTIYVSRKDIISYAHLIDYSPSESGFNIKGYASIETKISGIPNSISVSEKGNIALCFDKKLMFIDHKGKEHFQVDNLPKKALLTSIAIEGDYIYVADAGRRMILQFDKKEGLLTRHIGKEDKAKGIPGFIVPSANFDIIPGGDGSIWAVNPGRLQIENLTSDGRLRSSWKSSVVGIKGFSGCCNPAHIALLPNGDFVTAEKNIVRVKVYDPTGKFKCVVATPQQFAEEAKIVDIATDSKGKIYLLDSKTKGIRVFVKKVNERPTLNVQR